MKAAFFIVSLICAATLGLLSYIMATGRIPMRPPVPAEGGALTSAVPANLGIAADEKIMLENLVESLKSERDAYMRKKNALEEEYAEQKDQVKVQILEKLKADLQQIQNKLESEIRGIQEGEKKNLQSIAEVYNKMEPANAAAILQKMEKHRAASILVLMNERQAAAVLDEVAQMGDDARLLAVEWAEIIRKMKSEEKEKQKVTGEQ